MSPARRPDRPAPTPAGLRRQPRQQRSRAMVERIVDAAREVLTTEGYDAFTTNRVAARADVSPGSLYQYFPDKAALVDVVAERWVDQVSEDVARALLDRLGLQGPAMVRSTADALLTALERDTSLLHVVWEDLPGARHRANRDALERRVRDVLTAYLAVRLPPEQAGRAVRLAWMVVLSTEYLTVRFVLDPDPPLTRDELLDEVVAMSLGYLGDLAPG
ncbi:TetR/AcrR family transcriptional regulator [Nocardioides sp. CPCC 205120]|uniref:TetR/AcrR family transcriptional regulator n=1 Tax=Nocardioides sp. CPCC 205120 TaxID=3406462 RepID=UPI003B510C64